MTKARNGVPVAVIDLQGRVHLPAIEDPFRMADNILKSLDPAVKVRFVDFHAELTSEKMAMGWYLDGRVSAMIGTHTHIPTADERILPGGTAYQTDVGMTGPYDSVIGSEKNLAIRRFLTGMPIRLDNAKVGRRTARRHRYRRSPNRARHRHPPLHSGWMKVNWNHLGVGAKVGVRGENLPPASDCDAADQEIDSRSYNASTATFVAPARRLFVITGGEDFIWKSS